MGKQDFLVLGLAVIIILLILFGFWGFGHKKHHQMMVRAYVASTIMYFS